MRGNQCAVCTWYLTKSFNFRVIVNCSFDEFLQNKRLFPPSAEWYVHIMFNLIDIVTTVSDVCKKECRIFFAISNFFPQQIKLFHHEFAAIKSSYLLCTSPLDSLVLFVCVSFQCYTNNYLCEIMSMLRRVDFVVFNYSIWIA